MSIEYAIIHREKKMSYNEQWFQLSDITLCWHTMWDFFNLMVKPLSNRLSNSECAAVRGLQILSTITWLLQHTNIILWAQDQISPPSRSLFAELQCQNPLLSFSFLFFTASLFEGSAWEFPPELPRPIPAPLHACAETDFYNSPADPRGAKWGESLGKCSSGV